jgi:hypothetical protein
MLSRQEVADRILQLPLDQQGEALKLALEVYGARAPEPTFDFEPTRFDPARYIKERLGWTAWAGENGEPGQVQVLEAYVLAMRQQLERKAFEDGEITEDQLEYWKPGQIIKNIIRIEAGHTVGKTKLASGIVNHFFDHFTPTAGYCFAPSWLQIHDLLFKEIKADRRGKGLPGRILDLELRLSDKHFIRGKATHDATGSGTERAQGQHEAFNIFVLDEAEGVADFVFGAIDSMISGGISVVIMLANPRTRTSKFHKIAALSNVKSFRISCLHHPNVVAGREIVPGAVRRDYVISMIEKHCDVVSAHSHDDYTFTVPFDVAVKDVLYPAGTIFKPNAEFMFRVLGVAPANIADKNLIPTGRFEAACKRPPKEDRPFMIRKGVDCARFGRDFGTEYTRWNGRAWQENRFYKQDSIEYTQAIKKSCLELAARIREEYPTPEGQKPQPLSLHIRVDGGGGFGSGIIDNLKADSELNEVFEDFQVFECHFGGKPDDEEAYYDCITEWTADVAETLKSIAVIDPPEELESDLCEREYKWMNREGKAVKKLEAKDDFRKRIHRSPDDGDGFTLATASDHLFTGNAWIVV